MKGKELYKILQSDFKGTVFESLLELSDCPKHMYYTGNLPDGSCKIITVVGSRAHTSYAAQALELVIFGLQGQRVCIVSGLALGIDAHAHKLALKYNIPTMAVPGSGLDQSVLYPASNSALVTQIVESGGVMASEFEPTDRAARWTFPKRNRIMAAMSDLVLVVEAGEKSGTLITARNALEYNREVAVIPGSIFNEQARGSNNLLKHGAQIVTSAQDLLDLLGLEQTDIIDKTYDDVDESEKKLLDCLSSPKTKDELQQELGCETSELLQMVTILEIKGHVQEKLGQVYKI